ncbi:hypothetical protein [Bacillus massilinigeriensis]|uniref:hypothetical protein n=1 Tax=Bacillus massilionigeriensis TaxID=1805475 RepID=UPI00096B0F99|nr:hypothetical protein [Bacillus massilionigeriensis]
MKIRLYWPNCRMSYNQNQLQGDAFWVECLPKEAEEKVYPFLSDEQIEESKKYWKQGTRDMNDDFRIETNRMCFLVSKDKELIIPMSWSYPYSGHWNGYCPFEGIDEVEIKRLSEIGNLTPKTPVNK